MAGAAICIALCFFLKLGACAVQQVGIGSQLGGSLFIKQQVGIHKPFIRAVESILRRPGWSFAKCIILCGGPDWPTSVIAGILGLSLFQCELGTIPIILYVTPLSLTGSFYVLQDEAEIYKKLGRLMFFLTAIMTAVMWAGMAWAIQTEFDQNYDNLTRPQEQYVHLDWLDHRAEQIGTVSVVRWERVPKVLRSIFLLGAIGEVLIGYAFFMVPNLFFSPFAVTDDFRDLVWYGDDGLCKMYGLLGLGAVVACFMGYICFRRWRKAATRERRQEMAEQMDAIEAEWKDERIAQARLAAQPKRSMYESLVEIGGGTLPRCSSSIAVNDEDNFASSSSSSVIIVPTRANSDPGSLSKGLAHPTALMKAAVQSAQSRPFKSGFPILDTAGKHMEASPYSSNASPAADMQQPRRPAQAFPHFQFGAGSTDVAEVRQMTEYGSSMAAAPPRSSPVVLPSSAEATVHQSGAYTVSLVDSLSPWHPPPMFEKPFPVSADDAPEMDV